MHAIASSLSQHSLSPSVIIDCDAGSRAGQHLRLRVFFRGKGMFEAHPLSIMTGPAGGKNVHSCIRSKDIAGYFKTPSDEEEQQRPIASIDMEPAGIILGA